MTQKKIDDLFSLTSSTRSGKRSRVNQTTTNNRDEFDDLFETNSSAKRRRTNNNNNKQVTDVFDFDMPSTSTIKTENDRSLKKKRSITDDNEDIDELFNNDTRKKLRRPIKQESTDILDMFKTKTNTNIPQTITTLDDFKTPISSKNFTTQKKIKMFFDDTDLIAIREQNEMKDYVHIKPVLITGGQWLSKEAETKSICDTMESSDNPTMTSDNIPDDQRNLMHIQYASLIVDDEISPNKKSQTRKPSSNSKKKLLDGKSFQKQLVLSDSTILRKENLQSCYNALLEDINKPRISATTSSHKQKKSSKDSDEEQVDNIDFFDLPTRRKKF